MVDLNKILDSSYNIPRIILKLCGCFPSKNGEYKNRNLVFINFYVLYIVFVTSSEVWMSRSSIRSLVISLELCIAAFVSFIKFYNYTRNRKLIYKLLTKIQKDYSHFYYINEEIQLVKNNANQIHRLIMLLSANIIFCAFMKLSKGFVFMYITPNPDNSGQRVLPLAPWMPFNIDIFADPYYQIMYVVLIFGMIFASLLLIAMDTLVCFLIKNLTCQYQILRNRVENFTNYEIYNTEAQTAEQFLMLCIKRHQKLNERADDLETFLNKTLLIKFSAACPFLCLSVFICTQNDIEVFHRIDKAWCLVSGLLQLFAYCFLADRLTEQALGLADSAYNSNWQTAPRTTKKIIFVIIIRSQREIYITAGKFCPVTVKTYETVVRTAMSYYTVLSTMTSKG